MPSRIEGEQGGRERYCAGSRCPAGGCAGIGEPGPAAGDDQGARAADDGCRGRAAVWGRVWGGQPGSGELPQRVPAAGVGHPGRDGRAGASQAAAGLLLPGVAAGAAPPRERALASVVATSYLLGVSTRRVEKLAESLGVTKLSESQVSVMAAELDELVAGFCNRPLDAGPYTFVWIDALTQKVREGGRTVNVHALIATGVNDGGHREILGVDVTTS